MLLWIYTSEIIFNKIFHLKKLYVLVYLCLSFAAWGQGNYSGGDGSSENPFQIAQFSDLTEMRGHPEDWNRSFILLNDLDLDPNLPGREMYQEAVVGIVRDYQIFYQYEQYNHGVINKP